MNWKTRRPDYDYDPMVEEIQREFDDTVRNSDMDEYVRDHDYNFYE